MKSLAFPFVLLLVAAAAPHQAGAASGREALALFSEGEYQAAAHLAAENGDAQHLALAARALNAAAYLEDDDKRARQHAKRALEFADAAIEQDPALVEAHLQSAISLAQRGARIAPWRAFFLGLAQRARERLDNALAIEPENAWALSTSAAWHLEVARRGGEGRFGADPERGFREFNAARAAAPDNLSIAYEYALRVLAYDRDDWREEALAALQSAQAIAPADMFEQRLQERAQAFQRSIDEGRDAERAFIEAQP